MELGKLSDTTKDKGDCVNCYACVCVCPTGIRNIAVPCHK